MAGKGNVGALFVMLGLDDKQYRTGIAGAVGTAKKSTSLIQANFSTLNFRTFLYGMAGIYAVKRAIEGIMTPSIAFESQLAQVSTQLNKSAIGIMPVYRAQLEGMSKAFGQSTESLSNGLYDILSSVIEPTKAMGLLDVANRAAVGGITDVATATSAIVTVMKSYGMEAEKASYISDVLFASVLRGRITFEQLASGMGVVTSSAAQSGLRFEELAAMISTISRAGVPPEMTLIAIANLLNKFVTSSDVAKEAAKKLGFELSTATLKAGGMADVMRALSKATAEEVNIMFPEMRGLRGINAALSDATGFLADLSIMHNNAGMTMEAFTKQYMTTKEVLKRFGQVLLVDVVRPFTDALLPAIIKTTEQVRVWLESNKEILKLKLTSWANTAKDALVGLFEFIIRWHKPIVLAMELMFGLVIYQKIISLGVAVKRLTTFLGSLILMSTAAKVALAGIPSALVGLGALAVGGSLYLGISAIKKHFEDIDKLKFQGVHGLSDTPMGKAGNLDKYTKQAENLEKLNKAMIDMAGEGKSLSAAWNKVLANVFKGDQAASPITQSRIAMDMFGLSLDNVRKAAIAAYNSYSKIKPTPPPKSTTATGWRANIEPAWSTADYIIMMGEKKRIDDDYWAGVVDDAVKARDTMKQNYSDEMLGIARDTEMAKLELTKSGTALEIAQSKLRLKFWVEDMRSEYKGYLDTKALEVAAEKLTAKQINLIRYNAAQEAAQRAAQAWEGFKDHFSHILSRMVVEGQLSAKAIGQAFADAIRQIAIERISKGFVNILFGMIAPGGATSWLGKLLSMGTGGMVYKPSLALVGESGPERVLNPAETRRYNSSNTDDHSNVNIHIHASSDDLRNMNPYKFAQLYKEAKRSQLLAG